MATYQFGVTGDDGGTRGLVQNFTRNLTGDRGYAVDENGDTAAANTYNEKEEVSFEWVQDTAIAAPAVGDTVTISTVKYTVTSVTLTEENQGYKTLSYTAERFLTNTIPAA